MLCSIWLSSQLAGNIQSSLLKEIEFLPLINCVYLTFILCKVYFGNVRPKSQLNCYVFFKHTDGAIILGVAILVFKSNFQRFSDQRLVAAYQSIMDDEQSFLSH